MDRDEVSSDETGLETFGLIFFGQVLIFGEDETRVDQNIPRLPVHGLGDDSCLLSGDM